METETREEFSKRIWDGGESDNVPQVNATVELAWQAKRFCDIYWLFSTVKERVGKETPVEHAEKIMAEEEGQ